MAGGRRELPRLSSHEANLIVAALDGRLGQARSFEPISERFGIHGNKGVIDVSVPDRLDVDRVNANEDPAGSEDAVYLGEQPVLQAGPRHVVQHREACHGGVSVGGKAPVGGIGTDHGDVGAGQTLG